MRRIMNFLVLLCLVLEGRSFAAELTLPFSPTETACAEQQLGRLQRRIASFGAGNIAIALGTNSLWSDSRVGGSFAGLVRLLNNGGNGFTDFAAGTEHFAEADLAFNLLLQPKASLLDPRQPPATQATLARRDGGTNLVVDHQACALASPTPDLSCPIVLDLDLAAIPGNSVNPQLPLVINSAAAAAAGLSGPAASPLPASSGTGPGIGGDLLAQGCGGRLTAFDEHVFELLARAIVPSDCYSQTAATCGNPVGVDSQAYNLTIFRGADPHTYRVDIYEYQAVCDDSTGSCFSTVGPLALEFQTNWDDQGRLTTGTVKVLPVCRAGQNVDCSNPLMQLGLFVVPPIFPGQEQEPTPAFHGAPYLNVTVAGGPGDVLEARINWAALLRTTALNQP